MTVRTHLLSLLLSLLLSMLAAGAALADPAGVQSAAQTPQAPSAPPTAAAAHALDAADLAAWLDGQVPYSLESGDIAGMAISVVKDGKVLLQKGYGLADVEARVPMDPAATLLRPGSTSKLFTWTAVMQLVQQGRIDLDRSVNDYLDFRIAEPYGKPVTMRHLMNHRAGFEEGLKDLLGYDPQRAQSTEQYLKEHPRPMLFAPGAVPAYSNYGVALAGYIVQRVSGMPFETYVERHIFAPLGMRHSTFVQPLPANFPGRLSKGYRTTDAPPSPFEIVITAPAGSVTTTAADMARFMLAHLQAGSLDGYAMLDAATTARMHGPSIEGAPGFGTMAHGFFRLTHNGRTLLGHGGDTVVYHTDLNLLPDEGVGIYFTYNGLGKDGAVYGARKQLMDGFMRRYFPDTAGAAGPPPVPASALADAQHIAGRYQSSRRVEHGFLRFFYLLQQTVITANPDGSIAVPDGLGGVDTMRAVGPQLWRAVDGGRMVALKEVDGVKTVIDSDNPVAVLQQDGLANSAPLNLSILLLSFLVLGCTLAAWPLGALLRRADRATPGATTEQRRLRTIGRAAAALALAYMAAWFMLIKPVLSTDLALYHSGNDWLVGLLQASGLLVIGAAAVGLWAAWRMARSDASRLRRAWAILLALALLGVVWLGIVGKLITWDLNY